MDDSFKSKVRTSKKPPQRGKDISDDDVMLCYHLDSLFIARESIATLILPDIARMVSAAVFSPDPYVTQDAVDYYQETTRILLETLVRDPKKFSTKKGILNYAFTCAMRLKSEKIEKNKRQSATEDQFFSAISGVRISKEEVTTILNDWTKILESAIPESRREKVLFVFRLRCDGATPKEIKMICDRSDPPVGITLTTIYRYLNEVVTILTNSSKHNASVES